MITIRDLKKAFQGKAVLRGVNLEVRDGEVLVVIGRSGCGKSVLLKHLAGLIKPDSGSITLGTTEITALDRLDFLKHGVRISILFQNSALFDSMTVRENVGFYVDRYSGRPPAERDELVRAKLELVDLRNIGESKPFELSGGMQKRVALARALIMEPEVMLYDEPTTGLDPITAESVNDLILDLNRKCRMTSIVVTHDLASAFKVADRIAMLHEGGIIALGTVDEIRGSEDPHVKGFLQGHYE